MPNAIFLFEAAFFNQFFSGRILEECDHYCLFFRKTTMYANGPLLTRLFVHAPRLFTQPVLLVLLALKQKECFKSAYSFDVSLGLNIFFFRHCATFIFFINWVCSLEVKSFSRLQIGPSDLYHSRRYEKFSKTTLSILMRLCDFRLKAGRQF